jgi:hypothetical protein
MGNKNNWKHGISQTAEYGIWKGMVFRCHNPSYPDYHLYGGRGIVVCDEWRDNPVLFVEHVGSRPGPEYTIDRIDNSRGYEPGNVRWATMRQQSNNTRKNVLLTYNGETFTIAEWAARLGINVQTLKWRLANWGSVEKAISAPVRKKQ